MMNQNISKKKYETPVSMFFVMLPPVIPWIDFLTQDWKLSDYSGALLRGLLYAVAIYALISIDYWLARVKIEKPVQHGIVASIVWGPFIATHWSTPDYSWGQTVGTVGALFVFGIVYLLTKRGWLGW